MHTTLRSRYAFSFLLFLWIGGTSRGLQCPGSKRRILTAESDVASLSALNAGSVLWPLSFLLSGRPGAVWCSQVEEFTGNTVAIEFSLPVLLETIVSRGDRQAQADPEYVSNATFHYAPDSGADLEILQTYEIASEQAECLPLDSAIQVKHLELVIHDVVAGTGYYCWNLELIGCSLSDAVTLEPAKDVVNVTTTVTVTETPTSTTESLSSTSGPPTQMFMALIIALPVLLLVVIIIITAVALGCIALQQRKKSNVADSMKLRHMTLCTVNNSELYNVQSEHTYSMVEDAMVNNPSYARSTSTEQVGRYIESTHNPLYSGTADDDCPIQLNHDPGVYEIVQDKPLQN